MIDKYQFFIFLEFETMIYKNETYDLISANINKSDSILLIINFLNKSTIIILYIELFVSLILNGISVFCILFVKAFTPINILIINLATSDILYASVIPFYVRQFEDESISQNTFGCRLSFMFDVISMIVRIIILLFDVINFN